MYLLLYLFAKKVQKVHLSEKPKRKLWSVLHMIGSIWVACKTYVYLTFDVRYRLHENVSKITVRAPFELIFKPQLVLRLRLATEKTRGQYLFSSSKKIILEIRKIIVMKIHNLSGKGQKVDQKQI